MMVQVTYPGVYIEEFAPGAPIEGVGTSTAAFIGPTLLGEPDIPTKVTSWDQFTATYGAHPVPGFTLWYAVRGFFENGGQVCYIVRATNAVRASLVLNNRKDVHAYDVQAREFGNLTDLTVKIDDAHAIPDTTTLYMPSSTFERLDEVSIELPSLSAAAQFRPGDWVHLGAGNERVRVVQVSGKVLRFNPLPANLVASGPIRTANTIAGTRTVRISPASGTTLPSDALAPGVLLTIIQTIGNNVTNTDTLAVESVQAEPLATLPAQTTYRVTFRRALTIPIDATKKATVQSEDFDLIVRKGSSTQAYRGLSVDSSHPRFADRIVNADPNGLVTLLRVEPPPSTLPPDNLLKAMAATLLADGVDEDLAAFGPDSKPEDFDARVYTDGLDALREIQDVNLVSIPERMPVISLATIQQSLITHCELMKDRFGVLDAAPVLTPFGATGVETQRAGLDSTGGYAAFYYPWIRVTPDGPGDPILVPPSGHICGIMARSDQTRGVHKAPANEIINGSLGVERSLSNIDHGQLNLQGINVIRVFKSGGRPVLYGARTTATDTNWQYINVRRLFIYVEQSVQEGIRWGIFEPNNLALWQKLKRTLNEFLTRVWRDGGLFGDKPEHAFYVRIDDVLNPPTEQALGRLHIEIGMRPSYPAEFIVVRIGIWDGGADVSEG